MIFLPKVTKENYLYRTPDGDLVIMAWVEVRQQWEYFIKCLPVLGLHWLRAGNQSYQEEQCRLGQLIGVNYKETVQ